MITGVRQAITRMSLDMQLPDVQKGFACTKGDVNRRLEITLTDGWRTFELPNTWTVFLVGRKPDDTTLNNGCVVERGKIIYDFASGAEIATCAGVFQINFEIYDETGLPVASPAIWVHVNEGPRDMASNDQFTALEELIRKINGVSEKVDQMAATVGSVQIPTDSWDSMEAAVTIPDMGYNTVTLLIPANEKTRAAADEAGIRVDHDRISGNAVVLVSDDEVETDLEFLWVMVKGRGEQVAEAESLNKPAVSLVGAGTTGSSSQIHVGDGDMPEDCILQIIPDEDDVILDDSNEEPEKPETPEEPDTPEETETYTLTINGSVYLKDSSLTNGASLAKGTSISTTLYPYAGNQIVSVTVTMGGVEVPGAFNAETSAFVIENITGDVIITAETELVSGGGSDTETEKITITIAKDEHVSVAMNDETVSGNITVNEGASVYLTLKLDDNYQFATGTPQVTTASGTNITADVYNSTMQEIALLNLTENITIILATEPIPVTAAE